MLTFPSTIRAASYNDATLATALATAGSVNAADYEQYGYDPNGNRTSLRKRDGSTLGYTFDALNRMTVKTVPSRGDLTSAQVRDVYYSYDLRNLQLSARFDSTSGEGITNIFDGFGRLTSTSSNMGGNTRTLAYQHDTNANRTRITHPDGNYFNTTYDGLNRPLLLQANGSTTIASNEYYAHGGPWVVNRIATATEISYDTVQRPYVLHHYLGGTPDVAWTSTFNPASQIASTVRTNDAYAWTGHYAVNRGYTTNGLNQYSAAAGTSFGYDDNGNLTASGASAYVYDIENRMVGAPGSTVLTYDPLGRLFQVSNASTSTQFLYDGDAMVAEYNGSNVLQRRHVHNVGADVPMATYAVSGGTGLGTVSQLFADRQGSIVTLANGSGVTTAVNSYDEYGIPGAGNTGRFQYTGQIWLNEIGMYYYKARIYSPTLGRFMQTDPIGYEGGLNLYAYVGNDPVNLTDPQGKAPSCPRNSRPADCPDIPLPPREMRESLARDVRASRSNGERGGQALENGQTHEIHNRTGAAAGHGTAGEFSHNPAPPGEHIRMRSHTHDYNANDRGLAGDARRRGQNGPSADDQAAMAGRGGKPIQTIGPDVTTTMFRRDGQDYVVIDSGDRSRVPNLGGQGIVVCQTDNCPP